MKSKKSDGKNFSLTRVVFETIDKICEFPQNPKALEKQLGNVQCISDVGYSQKYPEMALDLFFLPDQEKYPVIFEIHGGGFSAGDKKYRRCLSRYYAQYTHGMVVNVNYGVGSASACPVPMQQLAEAVNWVAANAEKYRMDLSRFVVTGDSAGAFYACFLCVLQGSEHLQQLFNCKLNTKITAAVLNCGVYDMQLAMSKAKLLISGISRELMGMGPEAAVKSPYFDGIILTKHVTPQFPQTLLIYSANDLFCRGQGEELCRILTENNVPTECICAKSVFNNHVYSLTWFTAMAKKTNERTINFLNEHFAQIGRQQ